MVKRNPYLNGGGQIAVLIAVAAVVVVVVAMVALVHV